MVLLVLLDQLASQVFQEQTVQMVQQAHQVPLGKRARLVVLFLLLVVLVDLEGRAGTQEIQEQLVIQVKQV